MSTNSMSVIDMLKLDTEELSIEKFASLTKQQKQNIRVVGIIPPRLGGTELDNDFGRIKVEYKMPVYKTPVFDVL